MGKYCQITICSCISSPSNVATTKCIFFACGNPKHFHYLRYVMAPANFVWDILHLCEESYAEEQIFVINNFPSPVRPLFYQISVLKMSFCPQHPIAIYLFATPTLVKNWKIKILWLKYLRKLVEHWTNNLWNEALELIRYCIRRYR